MTKAELLKGLIEYVEAEEIIPHSYVDDLYNTDGQLEECYCSVGYLMKKSGVDFDRMESLTDGVGTYWNNMHIEDLLNEDYDLDLENYLVFQPLMDLGFTKNELHRMQTLNDALDVDRFEGTEHSDEEVKAMILKDKQKLLDYLNELLQEA